MRRRATILDVLRDAQNVGGHEQIETERGQERQPDAAPATASRRPGPGRIKRRPEDATEPSWWQGRVALARIWLGAFGAAALVVVVLAYAVGVQRGAVRAALRDESAGRIEREAKPVAQPGHMRETDLGRTGTASEETGIAPQTERAPRERTPPPEPPKPEAGKNMAKGYRVVTYKSGKQDEPKIKAMLAHLNEHLKVEGATVQWLQLSDRPEQIVAVMFDPARRADAAHRDAILARLKSLPPLRSQAARFDFAKDLQPSPVYGEVR